MATNTSAFHVVRPATEKAQAALIPEPAPTLLWGQGTPDGDREPFLSAQKGTLYMAVDNSDDTPHVYQKVDEGNDDADWLPMGGLLGSTTAVIDLEQSLLAADGAALAASETAGDFFRQIGTNQLYIQGEEAISETEVSVGWLSFVLPNNYVPGGTVTLRAVVDLVGAGTPGTCTVDFEARLQTDATGAVGSDLVTTAATAVSATGAAKDFTVTPTGLVAGDKLVVKLTTSIAESGGSALAAIITKLCAVVQVR